MTDQDEPDHDPHKAVIRRVVGRGAKDSGRGLPAIAEIEMEHADGTVVSGTALPVGPTVRRDRATGVCEIRKASFAGCPICLADGPLSAEHVPPRRFGGAVMTQTCERCNNTFGSRTEAAMLDWYDGAVRVIYRAEDDPRPLADGRVLHLRTEAGEVMMMPQTSGPMASALAEHLRAGRTVVSEVMLHDAAEVQNGMLKSAYLAAGLHLGGIPHVASAHEIRQELLDVVEARSRSDVVAGPHATRIRFCRTGSAASGPPLALMRTETDPPAYLISLAGTILVDWPFPEIDPVEWTESGVNVL